MNQQQIEVFIKGLEAACVKSTDLDKVSKIMSLEKQAQKLKDELDQVWDMLARAMSVIDDLTNLRPPCARTQQEIDDLIEGIHELEGPQE